MKQHGTGATGDRGALGGETPDSGRGDGMTRGTSEIIPDRSAAQHPWRKRLTAGRIGAATVAAVALVAAVLVALPATGREQEKPPEMAVAHDVMVAMRDGVRLA